MVKIGFICEGDTEQILLESSPFKQFLKSINIESLPVINAQGSGNLLPHNISPYITLLEKQGAEKIVIVTDLDEDVCITKTKQRISARPQDTVIVAVKQVESWFLACSFTMRAFLRQPGFSYSKPEDENIPFETVNNLMITHLGEGIGRAAGKIKLINRLLDYGLDITQAADHSNCPSAQYFVNKLTEIGKKN